jgi:hypothetical protein
MRFFLLLLTSSLFATVNEPLRFEVFSGYRNDRIHWHLQEFGDDNPVTYSELYRDVQFWENGLVLKVVHRDLTFFLRGAYGTFGSGTLIEKPTDLPQSRFDTNGWTADGSGYFGYAVNLTADRTYKVILTPLIGYSGHFEHLQPRDFRLSWNGFLFGGSFTIQPGGHLAFNVGYAYNIIHNNVHAKFNNGTYRSMKTNSDGNMGQSGWAQMDFLLRNFWRIGLGGQINYFSSRVVDATIRQLAAGDMQQKFKLRETSVSGWGQISREF